jgi:alkylation response protein AidB-like acyl-CoA dehydrogenase
MSMVHHYRSNLRDLEFNLFEFLDVASRSFGKKPFENMTEDVAREALRNLERLCSTELAASFVDADRHPTKLLPDGTVQLPDSLKKSLDAFYKDQWHMLELPEHMGGYGSTPTLLWSAMELLAGSNPVLTFYLFGTFIARIIDGLGTDAQKARYLPHMIERKWGGAMVLTEPDAGSDVGAGRTKARHVAGDVWEIEGVKRFITNGDYDYVENVVHLVLARPEGAAPGTKGLSLFIVPKYWVNEDGSLGERNGMRVSGLEKKMGIKSSATCEMTYGDSGPCRGLLMGNAHDGIRMMFHVIEQARMAVGIKSMSTLSTAYMHAKQYAKERVQGPDLTRASDKTAPRVRIIQHPDVRRMLMSQKAHAEGMRALVLFNASIQDEVELAGGHGANPELDKLNDMLLPLVKGYCSEKAYEQLALSLQTFGGSGYVQDWPIEQYIRDQKIDTLYEGTTAIQALDLFARKIAKDGGQTLQALVARAMETITSEEGGPALAEARAQLATAIEDLNYALMGLMGKLGESVYHLGLQGTRILAALAETVIAWLLIRHAAVAVRKLPSATGDDKAFYEGKVASAKWFAKNVLPGVSLVKRFVEESSLELMELPEEAF